MLELKSGVMPKLGVHLCILIWIWLIQRIEMTNVGKSQNMCFLLLSNCMYALLIGGFWLFTPQICFIIKWRGDHEEEEGQQIPLVIRWRQGEKEKEGEKPQEEK